MAIDTPRENGLKLTRYRLPMGVEILSPAGRILRSTRDLLFASSPLSEEEIQERWIVDGIKSPQVETKNKFDPKEEKIMNDWIVNGIGPPEGSGYVIDSNNTLRREEDLQREIEELEKRRIIEFSVAA